MDRVKVSGGGAMLRTEASRPAVWIHQNGLDNGSVIDYDCGYGKDAETFSWDNIIRIITMSASQINMIPSFVPMY